MRSYFFPHCHVAPPLNLRALPLPDGKVRATMKGTGPGGEGGFEWERIELATWGFMTYEQLHATAILAVG